MSTPLYQGSAMPSKKTLAATLAGFIGGWIAMWLKGKGIELGPEGVASVVGMFTLGFTYVAGFFTN